MSLTWTILSEQKDGTKHRNSASTRKKGLTKELTMTMMFFANVFSCVL
jgi:hypothetical protein